MTTDRPVAPDWVQLVTVPQWLKTRFGLRDELPLQDVISAVRNGTLVHRVPAFGNEVDSLSPEWSVHLPEGLAGASDPIRAVVAEWDKVDPDWPAGTIRVGKGRRWPGGSHHIELYWTSVEAWFVGRGAETTSANKGGRPPHHNWDEFWIEVVVWTAMNDVEPAEERRPQLRRHMLEWSTKLDDAPDTSTIDRKLSVLFKRVRQKKI